MSDQLISFKTAKLAKKKGFDITSIYGGDASLYDKKGEHVYYTNYGMYGSGLSDGYIKAATQSFMQKWLRDEHNVHIYIVPYGDQVNEGVDKGSWFYSGIRDLNRTSSDQFLERLEEKKLYDKKKFKTYEEALEFGLQQSLKKIK